MGAVGPMQAAWHDKPNRTSSIAARPCKKRKDGAPHVPERERDKDEKAGHPPTNPESGTITYAYDADGNVATKTAPLPNQTLTATVTTTNTYDKLNRLTSKSYKDGNNPDPYTPTVQFGYDAAALSGCTTSPPGDTDTYPIGRRTAMCDGSGATSWAHDKMGRVLTERRTIGAVLGDYETDAYNLNGSPITVTTLGYGVSYTYDGAARPLTATNYTGGTNKFVSAATYAPPGELSGATLGSATGFVGFTVTNSYNDRLQPILLSASSPSATVFSDSFDFHLGAGDNGNVYKITNNRDSTHARDHNFMYDSLNRIQQAYSSGSGTYSWGETFSPTATSPGVAPTTPGIDAWGNLTNRSGVTGKTYSESLNCPANTNNQLTACTDAYDAAGNMTGYGTASYVYDAENRLIATAGYSYIYDGDGQRVEKCTEGTTPGTCATGATGTLYWRGLSSDALSETDLAGTVQNTYVFFGGQRVARRDSAGAIHYYFSDHLGSHGVVENATGTACEQDIDYYPYGGEENDYCTTPVSQHHKFTGKERDSESGLDYFGARYLSSAMGRWISSDKPFADQHLKNPQSWNLYMYAANRPTSLIDTDGEEVKEVANTVYYHVSGSTAGEAWNSAPSASGIPGGFRGDTSTNIGVGDYAFSYSYKTGSSGATVTDTVKSAEVDLTVTTTLPTWDGYKNASPEEQKQWDSLAGGLQDHENGHKDIAEKTANDLDKSLPGTTASGSGKNLTDARKDADSKLSGKIEDKHQQTVQDTQKKQDAYDNKTEHGAHQERKNDPD